MTSPVFDQDTFRGRNDENGVNVDAGWYGAANGDDWTQDVDVTFRVRFVIQETAGGMGGNTNLRIYYEKNGDGNPTGSTAVTTATSDVILVDDSQGIADNETTTQVIGGGSYVSGDSEGWDDGQSDLGTGNIDFGGNDEAEVEFCLQIVGADVADEDSIQLYVLESDATQLNTYTDWPDITVNKVGAARRIFVTHR